MNVDPAMFVFDLIGAIAGLALFWIVGRRMLYRWAERERSKQEYRMVQRLRFEELVRGGKRG